MKVDTFLPIVLMFSALCCLFKITIPNTKVFADCLGVFKQLLFQTFFSDFAFLYFTLLFIQLPTTTHLHGIWDIRQ